jgi:hypothetical protein
VSAEVDDDFFQSGGERTDRISGLGIAGRPGTIVSGETYLNEVNHRRSVIKDTDRQKSFP